MPMQCNTAELWGLFIIPFLNAPFTFLMGWLLPPLLFSGQRSSTSYSLGYTAGQDAVYSSVRQGMVQYLRGHYERGGVSTEAARRVERWFSVV